MTNDDQSMTMTSPTPAAESTPAVVKRPRGRPRKIVEGGVPVAPRKRAVAPRRKVEDKTLRTPETLPTETAARHAPVSSLKYIFAIGRRKRAVARVFFYLDGKGEFEVNGKPLRDYFPAEMLREIIDQPLRHSAVQNSARIVVKVHGGGIRGQAGAVRLGIARALVKLDENLRLALRGRGYLTRDPREKERKKPGLKRARRGPQWAKR